MLTRDWSSVEVSETLIDAYVAAGHVIANHSHSHEYLWNGDAAEYISDLDRAEAALAEPTLADDLRDLGYLVFGPTNRRAVR